MTVKAGEPLVALVRLCYTADRPVLVVGQHGVGKSELLAQAAAELEIDYICRDLSLMEPTDLIGLPRADGAVTRYSPPSFLPQGGKGLLVFEELNRCPEYMRAPCLQLLTARSLNDYTLPPGWLPVAAVNPAEAGYEVEELDAALLSRFVRVAVEPDPELWLDWARGRGIHPGVISYVGSDPAIFEEPESNPRAWTYVSDLLRAAEETGCAREILTAAVAGLVGPVRAVAFLRTLRDGERPLTVKDVLAYPKHCDRLRSWVAAGRLDLARGSLLAVQKQLQARANYDQVRKNRTAWKHLGEFLGDLPGDLCEAAATFFTERGYDVPRVRRSA
jgi:hypothetical protein